MVELRGQFARAHRMRQGRLGRRPLYAGAGWDRIHPVAGTLTHASAESTVLAMAILADIADAGQRRRQRGAVGGGRHGVQRCAQMGEVFAERRIGNLVGIHGRLDFAGQGPQRREVRRRVVAASGAHALAQTHVVVLQHVHQAARIGVALAQGVDDAGRADGADDDTEQKQDQAAHGRSMMAAQHSRIGSGTGGLPGRSMPEANGSGMAAAFDGAGRTNARVYAREFRRSAWILDSPVSTGCTARVRWRDLRARTWPWSAWAAWARGRPRRWRARGSAG